MKPDSTMYSIECRKCKGLTHLRLDDLAFMKWAGGMYIQDAFPELDTGTRELLMSKTCGPCFDKMFTFVGDDENE